VVVSQLSIVQLLLSSHDAGPIGTSAEPSSIDDASDERSTGASPCAPALESPHPIPAAAVIRPRNDQAERVLCVCMVCTKKSFKLKWPSRRVRSSPQLCDRAVTNHRAVPKGASFSVTEPIPIRFIARRLAQLWSARLEPQLSEAYRP
jgi:hypothetical protein